MTERSFETTKIEEWSAKNTEDWLKWCLDNYQLEDPYLYTKIKLKGKTLLIYHKHKEFNKFYSEYDAEKLHQDLENRSNPPPLVPPPETPTRAPIHTERKQSIPLWDKFEKQLDEINRDFGNLQAQNNQATSSYSKELVVEALFSLKSSSVGNAHVLPIECLVSRMANTFTRPHTNGYTSCETLAQQVECGKIKLRLSIDDAVGFFVQKFYLHSCPALAELMLEHIVYLGQQNAIQNDSISTQYPILLPIIKIPRSFSNPVCIKPKKPVLPQNRKFSEGCISSNYKPLEIYVSSDRKDSEYSTDDESGYGTGPRPSIASLGESLDTGGKPSLSTIDEETTVFNQETTNEDISIGRGNQDSIFIDGNHIVVDHTMDQFNGGRKLVFDYDSNLMIKFEVNSQGEHPKTITNMNNMLKIKIENTIGTDIGFSLRAYNLSMSGNVKVLYPVTKEFHVLASKNNETQIEDADKWEQDLELQMESAGDYIIFELVLCSFSESSSTNTWNIQRNFMHVKCETENPIAKKTSDDVYKLTSESMGSKKRKNCIQIVLESLYHYHNNEDYEKTYWLATQLLLLPDFQRPQLLVLCWLIIGTQVYRDRELDFLQQRRLIALINAGADLRKKFEALNINTLRNIMKLTEKSELVLRDYLEKHKIRRSRSSPEVQRTPDRSSVYLPQFSPTTSNSPAGGNSPVLTPDQFNKYLPIPSITKALSEPTLCPQMEQPIREEISKATLLLSRLTRKSGKTEETLTFDRCEIKCPPCETNIDILFGFSIMATQESQVTIVPGILHLATLELSNELDNGTCNKPYKIKFPLPTNIGEKEIIRVIYHNGEEGEDITEGFEHNFNTEAQIGSISVPRNGNYVILGVEGYPSKVANYVANEIMCLRPLYALLWTRNKGCNKEIWCCFSCQEDRLMRPPHKQLDSICKLNVRAKLNSKIEISVQINKKSQNEPPDMKYEFYLTEMQGIYTFVQELELGKGKNEAKFTVQSPIEISEKDVLV